MLWRVSILLALAALAGIFGCSSGGGGAQDQTLSITWAKWVPSDVLEEMAREWGKANNVTIKTDFVPWKDYGNKVFTEFNAKGTNYDIIIGDSQWIGKGASEGHYLELTDWMKAELNLKEFEPAALRAFCEYPTGSSRYYAAPCETDACGFAFRKDLFDDAKEKDAFKARYNRELAPPKTWMELKDIAEFFTRPDQKLYGLAIFTDSGGYDAVTMGFQQVMWSWGGSYCDQDTFQVEGVLNSAEGIAALEFYRELTKYMPPGGHNYYHQECLQSHIAGSVAMSMNYFALFPTLVDAAKNPKYAKLTDFFAMPAGPNGKRYASLGGQGFSIVKYTTPEKQALAKKFIKWFLETDNQKRWASKPGCFSANLVALQDPAFFKAAPFNHAFAESMPLLRDFYNIPEYAELLESTQKHWNAAIVPSAKVSARQAMDAVAKEHTEILKKAGLLK